MQPGLHKTTMIWSNPAALFDLQNELHTQDGKQIDAYSAAQIHDTVTDLAEGLEISLSGDE